MADVLGNFHDLVIAEPEIIQVEPLALDETERKVVELLEPMMVKEQTVPKAIDLVAYVECPGGCDTTHTRVDGVSKWTGLFWFSCMDIQSFTKTRLLQELETMYGEPTGCGAEGCTMSRFMAFQQMDKPDNIPCLELDCDILVRPEEENNCKDHTEASVTAMVLMEARKFTRQLLVATKKVLKVLTSENEQDPTGLAGLLKLNFPALHMPKAGLKEASGSGFSWAIILSMRQVLYSMEAARTGTKRVISSGPTQVFLDLVSSMRTRAPIQVAPQPKGQALPEHEFRQKVAKVRAQMAARTDIPRTSVKLGKVQPRLHDRDPAAKLDLAGRGEASGKRKRDQTEKNSKFVMNCTMTNQSTPMGKKLTKWSDVVSNQHITSTTVYSSGINNKMLVQVTKSWDSQGRCTTCASRHNVLDGDTVLIQLSDQHSPAVLAGGPGCVGTFRVLNAGLNDLVRFILEPAIVQIETRQQKEVVDFGLITVIEQCVKREKKLVLGVTSGTGEYTEGPLSYSSGMDRALKWANSKHLKVDTTGRGRPKSIVQIFFPAPALPYMESAAYTGPVTPESIEDLTWDLQREATAWGRTLTANNSRDGHLTACENLYTKEKHNTDPVYGAIRSTRLYEYLHSISGFTPNHIFTAVQPSKFSMGMAVVTQPHPARSIENEGGMVCLRPGYMAAYVRSLIPVYMAYAGEPMDKGLVATYLKARANNPNILLSEKSWAYMCFNAGQQDRDAPTLVCVNRARHSTMQEFGNLAELNQHMATCITKHEELVIGKCNLSGVPDFPPARKAAAPNKDKDE